MIVSHSLGSVQKLCDSLLWLNDGQVMMQGDAKEVIKHYMEFMDINESEKDM